MHLNIKGKLATIGQEVTTFKDEKGILVGIDKPLLPSSTGKVYVELEGGTWTRTFYPSVIGGEWVGRIDDK